MARRIAAITAGFLVSFAILAVSVLRSAAVKYVFSQTPQYTSSESATPIEKIPYEFPYPGKILPGNVLWPLKVARDRAWIFSSLDYNKKAEIILLVADKRLMSSQLLFEKGKPDRAVSTLTKAEKYLERAQAAGVTAREKGADTGEFWQQLALSSLKHQQVLRELQNVAPEDARPVIVKTEIYSQSAYDKAKAVLMEDSLSFPESPFKE